MRMSGIELVARSRLSGEKECGSVLILVMLMMSIVLSFALGANRESAQVLAQMSARAQKHAFDLAARHAIVCILDAAKHIESEKIVESVLKSEFSKSTSGCGKSVSAYQNFLVGKIAVHTETRFCGTFKAGAIAEEIFFDQYVTFSEARNSDDRIVAKHRQVWQRQRLIVAKEFLPDTTTHCKWNK